MTSFARVVALAAMLCSAAASAQSDSADAGTSGVDESVNPHSVDNRNRKPAGAASPEEQRSLEEGEEGSPASVLNRDAPKPKRLRRGELDRAEGGNPHSVLAREKLSPRELVEVLHVSNTSEIAAGKMAQQKGSPPVADYGLMLVIAHQAMDEKLNTAAGQLGLKPAVADQPKSRKARKELSDAKKMQDKLSQLSGPQFDRAFTRSIAADQRKAIEVVQVARGTCEEPALCSLLDQTLPMLRAHEQRARALEKPPVAQGRRGPR
jgi:predicted outer membrane protein